MIRRAKDMSEDELNHVIGERVEARMLLRRWLKKHPDSALVEQTEEWLTKNAKPEDILR